MPTLKTLVLGGEVMNRDDMLKWAPMFNCSMLMDLPNALLLPRRVDARHPTNIGYGTGASCWIVDENDSEKLLPPGAVGEILICGPIVSRGYVGDAQQTTEAFIPCPKWLPNIELGHGQRFYKTGDLAKYLETDGSIQFLGRKDTQAKIHGQRIELGSVEYHVRQYFPSATDITVEVVVPANENDSQLSVAFLAFVAQSSSKGSGDLSCQAKNWLITPSDEFRSQVHTAKTELGKRIPSYMVPDAFLPISSIPLTASNKVNRRLLCQIAKSLTPRSFSNIVRKRRRNDSHVINWKGLFSSYGLKCFKFL